MVKQVVKLTETQRLVIKVRSYTFQISQISYFEFFPHTSPTFLIRLPMKCGGHKMPPPRFPEEVSPLLSETFNCGVLAFFRYRLTMAILSAGTVQYTSHRKGFLNISWSFSAHHQSQSSWTLPDHIKHTVHLSLLSFIFARAATGTNGVHWFYFFLLV